VLGAADARVSTDDLSHGHAHCSPAEPPRTKEFRAQLVDWTCAHALLAARHADVVDPHEAREFDGQLAARSGLDPT
jgi:hypothetical protein